MDKSNGTNMSLGLSSLPNEIVLQILLSIPTPSLIPLVTLSHRFYNLVVRIIRGRLIAAAGMQGRHLIFESYHPSAKLTTPWRWCTYLGTEGLEDWDLDDLEQGRLPPGEHLRRFDKLYSRFRPYVREIVRSPDPRLQRKHPAGDIPGTRTYEDTRRRNEEALAGGSKKRGDHEAEQQVEHRKTVSQLVNIDAQELFSQLCAQTNLVQKGPKDGLFHSFVPVAEGVIRLRREWLADRDAVGKETTPQEEVVVELDNNGAEITQKGKEKHMVDGPDVTQQKGILWIDNEKKMGIRFNVRERKLRRSRPVLMHVDEDVAVSYEIDYDEVLVQTKHLMLVTERSLTEESKQMTAKAMVYGYWHQASA